MEAYNHIQIAGAFEPLFSLAADIARWPDILPHYRRVKVLGRAGNQVTAEMAARHKGIPVWWKSIQTARPEHRRIHYTHIGGITRGMEVDWVFTKVQSPRFKVQGQDPTVLSRPYPKTSDLGHWTLDTVHQERWHVQIYHRFDPSWPLLGPWIAERIIGKMFVEQIAGKTLECLKRIVEKDNCLNSLLLFKEKECLMNMSSFEKEC